jgi:hypothetical protein
VAETAAAQQLVQPLERPGPAGSGPQYFLHCCLAAVMPVLHGQLMQGLVLGADDWSWANDEAFVVAARVMLSAQPELLKPPGGGARRGAAADLSVPLPPPPAAGEGAA